MGAAAESSVAVEGPAPANFVSRLKRRRANLAAAKTVMANQAGVASAVPSITQPAPSATAPITHSHDYGFYSRFTSQPKLQHPSPSHNSGSTPQPPTSGSAPQPPTSGSAPQPPTSTHLHPPVQNGPPSQPSLQPPSSHEHPASAAASAEAQASETGSASAGSQDVLASHVALQQHGAGSAALSAQDRARGPGPVLKTAWGGSSSSWDAAMTDIQTSRSVADLGEVLARVPATTCLCRSIPLVKSPGSAEPQHIECLPRLHTFLPQHLSNLAWACGRLGYSDPHFLGRLSAIAIHKVGKMEAHQLPPLLAGMVEAGHVDEALFAAAIPAVLENMPFYSGETLTALLASFSAARLTDPSLLQAATARLTPDTIHLLRPTTLCTLITTLAQMKYYHAPTYHSACQALTQHLHLLTPSHSHPPTTNISLSSQGMTLPQRPHCFGRCGDSLLLVLVSTLLSGLTQQRC
ncbi:MAG: hypothetical protein WDW38_002115 [Sanguina aurantia]